MKIRIWLALPAMLMCVALGGNFQLQAFDMQTLDSVVIDADQLMQHQNMRTTEIQYGNRLRLGKFYSIAIYDLMQAQIDLLPPDNLHAASIVCVAADGRAVTLSMAEVHPSLSQSPARILLGEAEKTQRGEVVLGTGVTAEIDDGSIDLGKLSKLTDPLILERLLLPHLVLDKQRVGEIQAAVNMLMTTNDVQAHRWIADISKIYIVMPS